MIEKRQKKTGQLPFGQDNQVFLRAENSNSPDKIFQIIPGIQV